MRGVSCARRIVSRHELGDLLSGAGLEAEVTGRLRVAVDPVQPVDVLRGEFAQADGLALDRNRVHER